MFNLDTVSVLFIITMFLIGSIFVYVETRDMDKYKQERWYLFAFCLALFLVGLSIFRLVNNFQLISNG